MIGAAAPQQAVTDRHPGAQTPFGEPDGSEQAGCRRKDPAASSPSSSGFGDRHGGSGRRGDPEPLAAGPPAERRRHDRQGQHETGRLGQVVVGLPDPLGPEVAGRARQATHVAVERRDHATPAGPHRPDELQIFEQDVAVVSPRTVGAPKGQRPRVVPAAGPVEKGAGGVPPGVPGTGVEEVLGADEVGIVEEFDHPAQAGLVVAHVVVGHDHPVAPGVAQAGENAGHLAVQDVDARVRPDVAQRNCGPGAGMGFEDIGG